jgi:hypothetical protein
MDIWPRIKISGIVFSFPTEKIKDIFLTYLRSFHPSYGIPKLFITRAPGTTA